MKLILTVDIDGNESHQEAHFDELVTAKSEHEIVEIRTNGGSVPAVLTGVREA